MTASVSLVQSAALDDDNESAAVGALILADPATRGRILGMLADSDLADPRFRFLLATVRAMVGAGVPVDQVTVRGYVTRNALLEHGPRIQAASLLHEICDPSVVPTSYHASYYAGMVVEAAARRRFRDAGRRMKRASDECSLVQLRGILVEECAAVAGMLDRAARAAA